MDIIDLKLETIGAMPKHSPKYASQPGVVVTPLPPDKQSVVDAFNVQDQNIYWVAEAICKMGRNMEVVMKAAKMAIEQADAVNRRLNNIQATPWAVAKRVLRWGAIFAAGVLAKYLLKKWFGIDIDVTMP